jgi:RND family efflux transporter MFP subunit
MTKARKKIVMAAIALIGLILGLIWVQGGFHSKVPGGLSRPVAEKLPEVKTIQVQAESTVETVTVPGTVAAREIARVAARILGYVVELKADAGDEVQKGQILLRIDTKEMAERLDQAKANLESAKADLTKARNDYGRFKALFENQSVAKKDYDDALAKYEVAQAAEQRSEAALEEARTAMSYGVVTSPFDGVVAERNVNLGDLATPGRTLMSIYNPETLELVAAVGEQYAAFVETGGLVRLEVPSIDLKQNSTVREVVPQRDEKSRTITIKAPLSPTKGLKPGLYGRLSFNTRASEAIVIPAAAVHVVGQLETVKVLEDGTIMVRHVKTGRNLDEGKVEIISGLTAGERVVIE